MAAVVGGRAAARGLTGCRVGAHSVPPDSRSALACGTVRPYLLPQPVGAGSGRAAPLRACAPRRSPPGVRSPFVYAGPCRPFAVASGARAGRCALRHPADPAVVVAAGRSHRRLLCRSRWSVRRCGRARRARGRPRRGSGGSTRCSAPVAAAAGAVALLERSRWPSSAPGAAGRVLLHRARGLLAGPDSARWYPGAPARRCARGRTRRRAGAARGSPRRGTAPAGGGAAEPGPASVRNREHRSESDRMQTDVVVVGAGLAGLVATAELADAGKRVILLDQEPEASLRRAGVLVLRRAVPRRLPRAAPAAGARLPRARPAGLVRHRRLRPRPRTTGRASGPRPTCSSPPGRSAPGCKEQGIRFFPVVGWAERGGYTATGPRQLGAALPHHLGHRPRRRRAVRRAGCGPRPTRGLVELRFRHRVAELVVTDGTVTGVRGRGARAQRRRPRRGQLARPRSATSRSPRRPSSSPPAASAATTTWCGSNWPARLGPAPQPAALRRPGARRRPDAAGHRGRRRQRGQRATGCGTTPRASPTTRRSGPSTASGSCPGPSSLWLDATGRRLPVPLFPGFDTLGTLAHIGQTGYEHTWFVATQQDRREGVRAVGLRAEPRPHRQGRAAAARPGPGRGPAAGAGLPGPGRGLRRRPDAARAGRRA